MNWNALVVEANEFERCRAENPELAKRAAELAIALPCTWRWVYDRLCFGMSEEDIERDAASGRCWAIR